MSTPPSQVGDYLITRAETEKDLVNEVLRSARKENDYFREKLAAKLAAYHNEECDLLRHYVEIKLYYPELAEELERHKPYLKELWNTAEFDWDRIKSAHS